MTSAQINLSEYLYEEFGNYRNISIFPDPGRPEKAICLELDQKGLFFFSAEDYEQGQEDVIEHQINRIKRIFLTATQ